MQRQVELIGAGWGLGGADPACGDAPAVLAPLVAARLGACGVAVAPGPILRPMANERRKQLAVSRLCGLLASAVADARRRGRLPCVLGGDHSCAGGTWSGVARTLQEKSEGSLGLLWIDAHMDSHTPGTSHTGRLHGMPLAWLLGQDDDPLYGLASGVVEARNVCIVGVRSFEPEERERLERLGVRVFFMDEIRDRGLAAVFREALGIVSGRTAAFGISIDLCTTPSRAPRPRPPSKASAPTRASRRSSWWSIRRAWTPRAAARASRSSCSPPPYVEEAVEEAVEAAMEAAGRARMRRSPPTRSTDKRRSFSRSSSSATAGRSSMPCAASPRKLGLR
jgi:arginase family enzyme